MTADDFVAAARVPHSLQPQEFRAWTIERVTADQLVRQGERALTLRMVGFPDYTLLRHATASTLHLGGEIVMEDSARELRKHLPVWMVARGRVLVTGLGLGCVVRGLLLNPDVDAIDVVELDADIIRVIGAEFAGNRRVNLHHGDALTMPFPADMRWDYAWHDLWIDGPGLQRLHGRLFLRYRQQCGPQGAWNFPREIGRIINRSRKMRLLGAPDHRRGTWAKPRLNGPSTHGIRWSDAACSPPAANTATP